MAGENERDRPPPPRSDGAASLGVLFGRERVYSVPFFWVGGSFLKKGGVGLNLRGASGEEPVPKGAERGTSGGPEGGGDERRQDAVERAGGRGKK